jgi:uncharacterized protein
MKTHDAKLLVSNNSKFESRSEQCNCACAGSVTTAAQRRELNDVPIRALKFHYQEINPGYELAFTSQPGGEVALLTSAGVSMLDSFHDPRQIKPQDDQVVIRKMIDLGFLHVDDGAQQDELKPSLATLNTWLHITDRCNLRCSYCYLPHVREDMSLETGHAALDALFRSAVVNHFKQVTVKYAGGEPLLRYPLILELHEHAQTLAKKRGLTMEEVILSNGTLLTHEIAAKLKSLSINLMISLDGLGQYHDNQRPYAGGHGSFNDVAEAIEIAIANGLTPNISVTVSSRTAAGLPEIMAWILDRELPFTLNFYRENDLSISHNDMRLDEQKIINGMLAAFKVIENNIPRRPFLGAIIDRADLSSAHTYTCGVGQNYLVFDQNGQVAKCQMHIRRPVTDVSAADPLALIRSDQLGIKNLSVEEKGGCKTCDWRYSCAGGCPLATHRATGRYDVKSPNCNIYKALFPEALRLEGLRLLKYQNDPDVVMAL